MERQIPSGHIFRTPLFADLTQEQFDGLVALADTRRFGTGTVLFRQGDPGAEMYVVVEGAVQVSLELADGKAVAVGRLGVGDGFGEISLFDHQERTATVTALEPTRTLVLGHASLVDYLERQPKVAVALLSALARRLRASDDLIKHTLSLDIPARLAEKLLALARVHGRHTRDGVRIDVEYTDSELGEFTGLAPEIVTAQLQQWSRQKLVTRKGDYLLLHGTDELARLL